MLSNGDVEEPFGTKNPRDIGDVSERVVRADDVRLLTELLGKVGERNMELLDARAPVLQAIVRRADQRIETFEREVYKRSLHGVRGHQRRFRELLVQVAHCDTRFGKQRQTTLLQNRNATIWRVQLDDPRGPLVQLDDHRLEVDTLLGKHDARARAKGAARCVIEGQQGGLLSVIFRMVSRERVPRFEPLSSSGNAAVPIAIRNRMTTSTPSPRQTIALVISALAALLAAPIHAATFSVDSGSDGADIAPGDGVCDADAGPPVSCTLRAAIQEANATPARDVVELPARAAPYLLTLDGTGPTAGELLLSTDVAIAGSGAGRSRVLALWENEFGGRILNVAAGVDVSLTGIALVGGEACGDGGAILNNGSLVLDSVTVRANLGERGGAISNVGTLTVVDSTLVQNRSVLIDDDPDAESCHGNDRAGGGAIHNSGTLEVVNTTLARNTAAAPGGALLNHGARAAALRYVTVHGNGASAAIAGATPVTLEATILSGSPACDPVATLASLGANVVGDATCDAGLLGTGDVSSTDPALAPLAWLDGAAFHEPTSASPAIDRAGQCVTVSRDQLQRPRPYGAACDAGAIEVAPFDTSSDETMWRGHRCTIVGTPADDLLRGTPGRDVICGLEGDDTLIGLAGNDILVGGRGSDTPRGGKGRDGVYGEWGHDRLLGGRGRDGLYGEKGRDILMGGRGPDRLLGGKGRDFLNGGR